MTKDNIAVEGSAPLEEPTEDHLASVVGSLSPLSHAPHLHEEIAEHRAKFSWVLPAAYKFAKRLTGEIE